MFICISAHIYHIYVCTYNECSQLYAYLGRVFMYVCMYVMHVILFCTFNKLYKLYGHLHKNRDLQNCMYVCKYIVYLYGTDCKMWIICNITLLMTSDNLIKTQICTCNIDLDVLHSWWDVWPCNLYILFSYKILYTELKIVPRFTYSTNYLLTVG